MQFSNYADFRTQVHKLIDGDDVSQSDLSADTLDLIISMGEQRLYREVRSSAQDASLSLTITANAATLPSDLLELRNVYIAGYAPIEIVPYETFLQYATTGAQGVAIYAAQIGDTLQFAPSTTGTLSGRYYRKFPDISAGLTSNTFFARHPDAFLYAALSEAAPFISDARLQVWEAKYVNVRNWLNNEEKRRVYNASRLSVKPA